MPKNDDLIGSAEAARLTNVDRATFNRWVTRGDIPVVLKAPGHTGPRLFSRAVIEQLARDKVPA